MTGIFKDFTEITKKLQQGETDKTDCTNENLRRIRLVTKEIGVMMTYTLLITKHAKIPENIEKFYQHVCHEEVTCILLICVVIVLVLFLLFFSFGVKV